MSIDMSTIQIVKSHSRHLVRDERVRHPFGMGRAGFIAYG